MIRSNYALAVILLAAAGSVACSGPQSGPVPADVEVDYDGMVEIEGGEFLMGSDKGQPQEGPVHEVRLDSYWIDADEVTNGEFAEFVEAHDYVTTAEEIGNSGVFSPEKHTWVLTDGADWRHPEGPGSSIEGREDHPVVHVSWDDAAAYCAAQGKRLPTEAEFEYAARGGLEGNEFAWGDEFNPKGEFRANTWQGYFPAADEGEDGYRSVAPVRSYPANGYGLYDIAGNVWEWTADWYDPRYYQRSPRENPQGPSAPNAALEKTIRGGSWLCSANYCQGYRVAARMQSEKTSGLNNLGFRCAAD